jgi:hypothetical protein
MERLAIRLGYWSSVGIVVTFVVFTACFVAIALKPPLFIWTGLPDYITYVENNDQFFPNLARLMMLVFGPLYVLMLSSIHELLGGEKRHLARISLCFGAAFAVLTGINYYLQLSAVRISIQKGETQGLEQVLQANPYSAVAAINVLGWSLFFGLSSLFVAPVFEGSRLDNVVRIAFILNGIFCLLGGIGYALDIAALVFFTLNLGMGGAVLVAAAGLGILFRRAGESSS